MSLGSAVLRPQSLDAAPAHGNGRAFDLIGEFLESLFADPEGLALTLEALVASGGGRLQAFLLTRLERFRRAEGKLRRAFKPFSDLITAFLAEAGAGVPESLPAALKALRGAVALLRKDNAVHMLRELIDLGRDDLDFRPETVEALFRECLEGAADLLQARVNGGDFSAEALKRYEWGTNLRGFEHLVLEELDWPSLDAEVLADALGKLYDRKGVEGFLGKMAKVLDAVESIAAPLGAVLQALLERRVRAGGGSVGAAAADGPGAGSGGDGAGGGESTTTEAAPVSWYASWVLHGEAHFRIDDATERIGPIPAISYNCLKPKDMEALAFHSLWITDLVETLLHIISIEQRDIASNTMNAFWTLFNTLNTPINKLYLPGWLQWVVTTPLTILGGLETVRCSGGADAAFPLIQILGDGGEVVLYKRWCWLAREFTLSVFTLANINEAQYDEWKEAFDAEHATELEEIAQIDRTLEREGATLPADGKKRLEDRKKEIEDGARMVAYRFTLRQANHNMFHGVVQGLGEVGAIVLPAILAQTDRINYGFIGGFITGPMAGKMFGGMAIALGFRGAGLLAAAGIARKFPDDTYGALLAWLLLANERFLWNPKEGTGETVGRWFWVVGNFFLEWVMQAIYLYLFTNGNTDGGTFPGYDRVPGNFPGFAPAAGAPHKLPWNEKALIECAQNPMGIWSHFPNSGQAYAYDFSHDAGTEVLASRGGIVTTLTQTNINNNPNSWNSIEVLSMQVVDPGDAGAQPAVPPPPNVANYSDTGTTLNPTAATAIEAGTLFPPYWDVYGNLWPALPNPFPLLPSGAVLPAGTALGTGLGAGKAFTFLIGTHDRGLAGVSYPTGATFADGTTPIPAGVVFAPDAPNPPTPVTPMYQAGTTFAPMRANFTAPPWTEPAGPGVPGFAPAAGATFLDGSAIPAGVVLPPDAAVIQPWLPRPHQATPLYLPGTTFFPYTATPLPTAGIRTSVTGSTGFFMMGTNFLPNGAAVPAIPAAVPTNIPLPAGQVPTLNFQWMIPVAFVFTQYGHAISGFTSIPNHTFAPPPGSPPGTASVIRDLAPGETPVPMPGQPSGALTDVFATADATRVQGQFVAQGRVIMLSGDTGVSAYNHLHTHVLLDSSANFRVNDPYPSPAPGGGFQGPFGMIFTAPFVYQDATHGIQHGFREAPQTDGTPHAMTWYESQNVRTGP